MKNMTSVRDDLAGVPKNMKSVRGDLSWLVQHLAGWLWAGQLTGQKREIFSDSVRGVLQFPEFTIANIGTPAPALSKTPGKVSS